MTFVQPDSISRRLKGIEMVYPTLKQEWDSFSYLLEWKDFSSYQERTIEQQHQGHEILDDDYYNAPVATDSTGWAIAPLFYKNIPYLKHTHLLPRTAKTIQWLNCTMYAGFARLAPGYELGWHYDPDPSPTIERVRVQLPFNTSDSVLHVNDDRMDYTEGKLMCFKSSALHRVENRSDMHRYSLIFDVFMPVRA